MILGSGGREHAIAWKIHQSKFIGKIYVAPGNSGTSSIAINLPLNINNHNEIKVAFDLSAKEKNKPSIIVCKTIKGKGVSYMENQVAWHYKCPNDEELQIAIKEIENA